MLSWSWYDCCTLCSNFSSHLLNCVQIINLSYLQYHHWPLLLSQWDSKVDISKWVLTLKKNTWGWFFSEPRLGPDMGTVHPGDQWVCHRSGHMGYGWPVMFYLGWVGAGRKSLTGTPTHLPKFLFNFGDLWPSFWLPVAHTLSLKLRFIPRCICYCLMSYYMRSI